MSAIKIKVDADGAGFARTMEGIEKRVHGLSHEMSHGLKEAFIGFVGVGSVGMLVENMVSYAEEITRASERLGIATDRVQELRVAARHAGKDLSAFDAVFRNLDKTASKGLVQGSKEANIASKLGLTEDDLKHANKDELLKKALEATKGMDRTQAESLLGGLVGPKNVGWLIGNRESILSGKGNLVGHDDLAALVEFKHSLEDMADVVRVALIPALTALVDMITHATAKYVDNTKDLDKMDAEAAAINSNKGGKEPSWWARINAGTDYQAQILFATGDKDYEEKAKKAKEDYIKRLYGESTYNDLMKEYTPPASLDDRLKEAQAERKKERAEEDAKLKGPVNREAPITKTAQPKEYLDKALKDNNSFLKLGV